MKYLRALQDAYRRHYLLAATATIIIIGFVGTINILLISMHKMNFGWMCIMLITVIATMRFLAFFLACYPISRVFEAALSGLLIQFVILLLMGLNFFSFLG